MPMLPRKSLASLICPSTPFLAPRFLSTPRKPVTSFALLSRCAPQHAGLQRPSYATKAKGKGKVRKNFRRLELEREKEKDLAIKEGQANLLEQLRAACKTRNVQAIMALYPQLIEARQLTDYDGTAVAQAIHVYIRNMPRHATEEVFAFAMQMANDIQTGNLRPHPWTHVHLLGIFKVCKRYTEGNIFWDWLEERDDAYVSPAVYGAAIELMAYGRKGSLDQHEQMYVNALKRFPGTFSEYHLSPNAIIPDRSRPIPQTSLPVALLQGIVTARVLAGDWKHAYLDLDTGLRLFPNQLPKRFFELFVFERPLPEAYTAFLVACRAGVLLNQNHLSFLMKNIRAAMTLSTSLDARVVLLRAIANAIYAYLEAGGQLVNLHISSFLNACSSLLPLKAPGQTFEGEEAEIRDAIVSTTHEILSMVIQAGIPAQASTFGALFTLAGNLHVSSLLSSSLQDAQKARVPLGPVELRTILTATGRLGEKAMIEEYWNLVVTRAEAAGDNISNSDWITFARACRRAQHDAYCREQMQKLDHTLSTNLTTNIFSELEAQEEQEHLNLMSPADFAEQLEHLKAQFSNVAAIVMSSVPLDMRKSPFYLTLDPMRKPIGTVEDMRTIYDEMTIDPHQPPPVITETEPTPRKSQPTSGTALPLDELRFLNWCDIVQMMDTAQIWQDKSKSTNLDEIENVYLGRVDHRTLPLPLDKLRTHIKTLRTPEGAGVAATYMFPAAEDQNLTPKMEIETPIQTQPNNTPTYMPPSTPRPSNPASTPKPPKPLRKMPLQRVHVLGLQPASAGVVRPIESGPKDNEHGSS